MIPEGEEGEDGKEESSLSRFRKLADRRPLDLLALAWMVCVLAAVTAQAYSRVRYVHSFPQHFLGFGWWADIGALGGSADYFAAAACLIGVISAAAIAGRAARLTMGLGALVSAWITVAGVFLIAAAIHGTQALALSVGNDNRAAAAAFGIANLGTALVVLLTTFWLLAASRRTLPAGGEPVLAELS